ncbi:MAG: 4-hydroxythreonine-4-phosphate dehydrogenase PdxA [Candidatus Scalindua sp.]|nr:4-hydroxythreonine-4-phosphate dehydrogenase PdxA [Candidatus Scalindua sp.]MBT6225824.1 4-hydroxythreonine-4-phosphate dehydrogenase PdxA [Candidatus Scalindua sp.]MBT6565047.1 4-hydroxythreonine-4-phosphate dehydrogenase PdxA [Candidatus Scalindua sp.]MBT7211773.1 4-hydroxythreonine-4-phosphate dehydrogenase PdxA [Candidatus Scalindua sp.]MBT7592453.1 4-hydroxythreonine-4-phosphate dehydrogenase PdxA [Candidatus Scalindua sp.]
MGDPGGIGPEVILEALASPEIRTAANYVIIGSEKVLSDITGNLGIGTGLQLSPIDNTSLNLNRGMTDDINVLDLDNVAVHDALKHKPLPESGRASVEYIMKGLDLALDGKIDALVTAPISKEAVKLAGFDFAGHTELLKEKTAVENVVMFMVGKGLRVSFVTTHLAINEVSGSINQENVFSTIQITATGLKTFFGIDNPKIAVCGLNPHCGDGDRFGTEERDVIMPAIERAQEMGIDCHGPLSADTVFNKALNGEYDIVVVQFHDQGTIPIKMHAFDSGVNITLGIPVIRTSPTHGTAFDIAGKGVANPGSMIEAIRTAVLMTETRKHLIV